MLNNSPYAVAVEKANVYQQLDAARDMYWANLGQQV